MEGEVVNYTITCKFVSQRVERRMCGGKQLPPGNRCWTMGSPWEILMVPDIWRKKGIATLFQEL